jgi:hypothetical protein
MYACLSIPSKASVMALRSATGGAIVMEFSSDSAFTHTVSAQQTMLSTQNVNIYLVKKYVREDLLNFSIVGFKL